MYCSKGRDERVEVNRFAEDRCVSAREKNGEVNAKDTYIFSYQA